MEMKNETIKIRVTKKEKDTLQQLSKNNGKSLSAYVLQKSLHENSGSSHLLPKEFDTLNVFNEIYHQIIKSGNKELEKDVAILFQKYFNYTEVITK